MNQRSVVSEGVAVYGGKVFSSSAGVMVMRPFGSQRFDPRQILDCDVFVTESPCERCGGHYTWLALSRCYEHGCCFPRGKRESASPTYTSLLGLPGLTVGSVPMLDRAEANLLLGRITSLFFCEMSH